MKISSRGLEFIKSFEGFAPVTYICPAGLVTVGFGHVVKEGECYGSLTYKQAEEILKKDLAKYEYLLNREGFPALSQNQFDALLSLAYNIGAKAFINSTLCRQLKLGKFANAANEFTRWVYCKGEVIDGLVRRRQEEKKLFLNN